MSRRASLPGADELFRNKPLVSVPDVVATEDAVMPIEANKPAKKSGAVRQTQRRRATTTRTPSGRERHDEKITVYLSPDELFDLDQARILLRGDLGLAADRGRIVRESLAVIISDLEAKGENSILARRLRGL
ncbi:MAG: hypothetical protein ACKOCL_04240 [Candidatus Nanopelagicaceae bacterium]